MRGLSVLLVCWTGLSVVWAGTPTVTRLDPDTLVAQSQYAGSQRDLEDVARIVYQSLTLTQVAKTGPGDFIKFDFKKNPDITPLRYEAAYATEVYTPMQSSTEDFTVTDVGTLMFDWKDVGPIDAYVVDVPKFFGLYDESRFVADFPVAGLTATGHVGKDGRVQLCAKKGGLPDLLWAVYTLSGKAAPTAVVIRKEDAVSAVAVDVEETPAAPVVEVEEEEEVVTPDVREQLRSLKALFDEGLITERVYEERQQRILDEMP